MFRMYCLRALRNDGIPYVAKIMQITASFVEDLHGRTPLEALTGETTDISQYLDFGLYDWVQFKEDSGLVETKIVRFLGVSHHIGSLMSYWFLPASGIPMSRITTERVTNLELQTEQCKKRFEVYDRAISEIFNDVYIEGNFIETPNKKTNIELWKDLAGNNEIFHE